MEAYNRLTYTIQDVAGRMLTVLHLRIKKEYPAEFIEDLIVPRHRIRWPKMITIIPKWEKDAIRTTLRQIEQYPEQAQS